MPKKNKYLENVGDIYWIYINWYKHYFGEDTRNWFALLIIREFVEILIQIFAIYNFNGLNIFDNNQLILASPQWDIKIFTSILCINCIIVGILWILYVIQNKCCHGQLFKQTVFVIDTIFDTFYALFPIIVVTSQSGFNLSYAVGSLQTPNLYVICF